MLFHSMHQCLNFNATTEAEYVFSASVLHHVYLYVQVITHISIYLKIYIPVY